MVRVPVRVLDLYLRVCQYVKNRHHRHARLYLLVRVARRISPDRLLYLSQRAHYTAKYSSYATEKS